MKNKQPTRITTMDTKDLLQINDFGEGMNTDTSDALMSKSSYRL